MRKEADEAVVDHDVSAARLPLVVDSEVTKQRAASAASDHVLHETLSSSPAQLESHGSFVSARDTKFWLAVAVASTSAAGSFSSVASSGSSSLDLRASLLDARAVAYRQRTSPSSSDRHLGLAIDIDEEDDLEEDDDDEEEEEEGDAATTAKEPQSDGIEQLRQVAPMTSPPPPAEGLRRPTILQNHRHRDRLQSDWRPSIGASTTTTSHGAEPRDAVASFASSTNPSPPELPPVVLPELVSFELAMEEVYEHQRYQRVLGWGAKGHLLPLDPAKFVRVVRSSVADPSSPQQRSSLVSLSNDSGEIQIQTFPSPTFPDITLPESSRNSSSSSSNGYWEWISPWHLELPVKQDQLSRDPEYPIPNPNLDHDLDPDIDGWRYASSFQQLTSWQNDSATSIESDNTSTSTSRSKLSVRRRKWIRYRRWHMDQRPTSGSLEFSSGSSSIQNPAEIPAQPQEQEHQTSSSFDDSFLDSMCGWLRKLGHVRKNWKRRYFVLEKSILRYYADESMTRLKGEVLLFHPATRVHYVDIHLARNGNGRDHTFAIQVGPAYTLVLQADRVSERENWMYCLEDALLCRDSYSQDPSRTQDVRESVTRRRNFSSSSASSSVDSSCLSSPLENGGTSDSNSKSPLMRRLLVECDVFLESNEMKQQIATFLFKFKQKYPASASASATSPSSPASSCVAATGRGSASSTTGIDIVALHDPRSLLALKNYRFFLERALSDAMDHLTQLPFAHASEAITSPKAATSSGTTTTAAETTTTTSEIDWQVVKRAVLAKLERKTFLPLQHVLYGLLESTIQSSDLAQFEKNRAFLASQPQSFLEIQKSHVSPSNWKSAGRILDSMDDYSLPSEKAAILLDVAKCIYATYAKEHTGSAGSGSAASTGSEENTLQMMAADDFLPIFIFLVARTTLQNVVLTRLLISETMLSDLVIGETGYYATMLEAAMSYIASYYRQ